MLQHVPLVNFLGKLSVSTSHYTHSTIVSSPPSVTSWKCCNRMLDSKRSIAATGAGRGYEPTSINGLFVDRLEAYGHTTLNTPDLV